MKTTRITINRADFEPREREREGQCPERRDGGCSDVDRTCGITIGFHIDSCDRCWALGPATDEATAYRKQMAVLAATQLAESLVNVRRERRAPLLSAIPPEFATRALVSQAASIGRSEATRLAQAVGVSEAVGRLLDALTPAGEVVAQDRGERWADVGSTFVAAEGWSRWTLRERVVLFFRSLWSRGTTGAVHAATLAVRERSCFGGAGHPPCPSLAFSERHGARYCADCGCGEKAMALLERPTRFGWLGRLWRGRYTKLMYPFLACPRRRPGFSNAET